VRLDQISYVPATAAPLAASLDQPRWSFRTGGPQPWAGAFSAAGAGGHLAYTTLDSSAPATSNWIETDITGPGWLTPSLFMPNNVGTLFVDNVITGMNGELNLSPGAHTLRWSVNQQNPLVTVTATLDNLVWQPTTWDGWLAQHFPDGTPAGETEFNADPDHDGQPNGVEAALGRSPLTPEHEPPLAVAGGGNGYAVSFLSPLGIPAELILTLESAPGAAGPWTEVSRYAGNGLWSNGSVYYQNPAPPGFRRLQNSGWTSGNKFFRFRVTM
jgi:hypothetical protein